MELPYDPSFDILLFLMEKNGSNTFQSCFIVDIKFSGNLCGDYGVDVMIHNNSFPICYPQQYYKLTLQTMDKFSLHLWYTHQSYRAWVGSGHGSRSCVQGVFSCSIAMGGVCRQGRYVLGVTLLIVCYYCVGCHSQFRRGEGCRNDVSDRHGADEGVHFSTRGSYSEPRGRS